MNQLSIKEIEEINKNVFEKYTAWVMNDLLKILDVMYEMGYKVEKD